MDRSFTGIRGSQNHVDPAVTDSLLESDEKTDLFSPGCGGIQSRGDHKIDISTTGRVINAGSEERDSGIGSKKLRRNSQNFRPLRFGQSHKNILHQSGCYIKAHRPNHVFTSIALNSRDHLETGATVPPGAVQTRE
jgi:hypothetical protein